LPDFVSAKVTSHCLGSNLNKKDITQADTIRHFGFLLDKTNNLPIDTVVKSDFEWHEAKSFNENCSQQEKFKSRASFWRHISIINDTDTIYNWIFQVHQIGNYEIYTKKNDSISYIGSIREHTNYDDRLYRSAWNVYPFKLAPGDSLGIYIKRKVKEYRSLDMSTKTSHRKRLELLQSGSSFKSKFEFAFIMLGFFLSLFMLSQFLIYRDKSYVYYGIYLFIGSLYFLHRYELDFEHSILFAYCMNYYSRFEPFLTYGLLLSYTLFGREFGDFKGKAKIQIDKYVRRLVFCVLFALTIHVLMITFSYDAYLNRTNRLMKIALLAFILPLGVVFYRHRTKLTALFLIGSFILVFGTVIAFMNRLIIESFPVFSGVKYDSYFTMRIVSLLDFFFFLLALAYKARLVQEDKNRAELEVLEAQFKALKAQLNPHFIFNCLTSIKSLVQLNRNEKADIYLGKFARLVRMILEFSDKKLVTLDDELEMCRLYIDMEKMRFGQDFNYKPDIASEIEPDLVPVPSLFLQPYLENAIHHGLRQKQGKKILSLEIRQTPTHTICTIDDNGIGRTAAQAQTANDPLRKKSYGIKLTQQRLQLYREKHERDIQAHITDKYDDEGKPTGTHVRVEIET